MKNGTQNANTTSDIAKDIAAESASAAPLPTRHPRKRVPLREDQLRAILRVAHETGNDHAYLAVQAGLSRSCTVCRVPLRPRVKPPDKAMVARVSELRARVKELSAAVAGMSERVPDELHQRIKNRLLEVSTPYMKSPDTTSTVDVPVPVSSVTTKSASTLIAIVSSLQKLHMHAADTERRASNVRTVLQKLKADAADNPDADVSQTINADWTVNDNEQLKRTKKTSFSTAFSSPIPTHRRKRREDSDDVMLSPFITPRSKMRRRATRCLRDVPSLRFDMPR